MVWCGVGKVCWEEVGFVGGREGLLEGGGERGAPEAGRMSVAAMFSAAHERASAGGGGDVAMAEGGVGGASGSGFVSGRGRGQPWVEKYRPREVQEVSHQVEVVAALTRVMETNNLPHMLFYGPPGTGKTTTALALCRQLYGPELYAQRVLELNASDERGIGVVRHKIKNFAGIAVGRERHAGHPCPPYKVIVLDEADHMTEDAQNALRRTMEIHSHVTRFIMICNYISRIIDPLTSRCAKFRFQPVESGVLRDRLRHIAQKELVEVEESGYAALERVSRGDMRRAITTLQSASQLNAGDPLDEARVLSASGSIPPSVTNGLLTACRTHSYDAMQGEVDRVIREGHLVAAIVEDLAMVVTEAPDLTSVQKAKVCERLAWVEHKLVDGADEELQLRDLCSFMMRTLKNLDQRSQF